MRIKVILFTLLCFVSLHGLAQITADSAKRFAYDHFALSVKGKCQGTTWRDIQRCLGDSDIAVEFFDYEKDSVFYLVAMSLCKGDAAPVIHRIDYRKDSIINVWRPLLKRLKGKKTVYFSPAGLLYRTSVEYLPEVIKLNVYRLTTTGELINKGKTKRPIRNAVLFGGLDYGNMSVKPLPHSKEEVCEIDSVLTSHGISCKVYTGKEGTKKNFEALSGNSPSILHFATHAFYYVKKATGKRDGMDEYRKVLDNPDIPMEDKALTNCGLYLSEPNDSSLSDGIISAREIAMMNLEGTDLVVLNGCYTGQGGVFIGNGVYGLARAFRQAGAKTVLMTMWKVDDHATEIFMDMFYECLMIGISKNDALLCARYYLSNYEGGIYSNPSYWASFVLLDALD